MRCPFCKKDSDKVVDSRGVGDGSKIRRRRECVKCSRRFTTYERVEEISLRVIKNDNRREPFDRLKLMNSLRKACGKRPVSTQRLEEVVSQIELELYERFDKEAPSKEIGELVVKKLRDLDEVAYVRFASEYRDFKDVSEFLPVLQPLIRGAERLKLLGVGTDHHDHTENRPGKEKRRTRRSVR